MNVPSPDEEAVGVIGLNMNGVDGNERCQEDSNVVNGDVTTGQHRQGNNDRESVETGGVNTLSQEDGKDVHGDELTDDSQRSSNVEKPVKPERGSACNTDGRVVDENTSLSSSLAKLTISKSDSLSDGSVVESGSSDQEGDLDSDGLSLDEEVGAKGKLTERGPQRSTSRKHSGKPYNRNENADTEMGVNVPKQKNNFSRDEESTSLSNSLVKLTISKSDSLSDGSVVESDSSDQEGDLDSDGLSLDEEVEAKGKLTERGPQRSTSRKHSGKPYERNGKAHQSTTTPLICEGTADTAAIINDIEKASDKYQINKEDDDEILNLLQETSTNAIENTPTVAYMQNEILAEDGLPSGAYVTPPAVEMTLPSSTTTFVEAILADQTYYNSSFQTTNQNNLTAGPELQTEETTNYSCDTANGEVSPNLIPRVVYDELQKEDKPKPKRRRPGKAKNKKSVDAPQQQESDHETMTMLQDACDFIKSELDNGLMSTHLTPMPDSQQVNPEPQLTRTLPGPPSGATIPLEILQVDVSQMEYLPNTDAQSIFNTQQYSNPSAQDFQANGLRPWVPLAPSSLRYKPTTAGYLGARASVVAHLFQTLVAVDPESQVFVQQPVQPQMQAAGSPPILVQPPNSEQRYRPIQPRPSN